MTDSEKKRALVTLYLVVATELIGFGLIIPILPQIAASFHKPGLMTGALLAAYSLAQFVASPILGSLSDRYGRKPVLVFSKLGSVLAYIILAVSGNYWLMLLARLLDGFTGGNISAARAYVADITSEADRPKGMAVIGLAFGTGFILGPALGGFLYGSGNAGFQLAAIVAGSLSLIAVILTICLLKEPPRSTPRRPFTFTQFKEIKHPVVISILAIQLVYMVTFSAFETTFSVYTHHKFSFSPRDNSLIFLYLGLLGLVIQGAISRRKSARPIVPLSLGLTGVAIGFLGIHFSTSLPALLIGLISLAFGVALTNAFLPAVLSIVTAEENRGATMGVYEGVGSISRVIGPLLGYAPYITPLSGGYRFFFGGLIGAIVVFGWFNKAWFTK